MRDVPDSSRSMYGFSGEGEESRNYRKVAVGTLFDGSSSRKCDLTVRISQAQIRDWCPQEPLTADVLLSRRKRTVVK